jgi:O-antigen/teichoic acid export membrane protein
VSDRFGLLSGCIRFVQELASGPIAKASGVSLAIRLAGLGLSFAQAVLTARLLGPDGYGTVAVVMSIVSILAAVCQFGLGELAVREIAARLAIEDTSGIRAFTRFATVSVVLLSLGASVALALIALGGTQVPAHYRGVLEIGALVVAPYALISLLRGIAQGFGRIALAQVPGELVRPAGLVLFMSVAAFVGWSFAAPDYLYVMAVVASFAALLAGGWLWRDERARLSGRANWGESRQHAAASLPFLGLAITSILQGEINTLFLGWLAGPHETGLFQPISRLTPVLTLAVQAAGMRYAPRMSEFWQRGEIERIRAVTATFTWTTTLATFVAALVIAGAGPWLMLVFGPEFRESAPLLWYVAGAQVFSAACGPVAMLLMMGGRSGLVLGGVIVGLIVNAALDVTLIPILGIKGAIVGLVVGVIIWNLILLAAVKVKYLFNPSLIGLIKIS